MKIGFVLFDEGQSDEGWASKCGEESYRISNWSQLDNDYIWISNIPFKEYHKYSFSKLGHIKESHYFRVPPSSIIKELKLENNLDRATSIISKIFCRIAKIGQEKFGVNPSDNNAVYRYANFFMNKILPSSFLEEPTEKNVSINQILESATQNYQNQIGMKPNGYKAVNLQFPKNAYFQWIFSQKFPKNKSWKRVKFREGSVEIGFEKGKEIPGTASTIKIFKKLSEENATLFNIKVKSIEPQFQSFATFGCGKDTNQAKREWVTFVELNEMVSYSKIEIIKAIKTESDFLPESVLHKSHLEAVSYSNGLFLENLFSALSSPIKNGSMKYHGSIPFLRAYDRMACFRAAKVLNEEGYFIFSYSVGKIVVLVPENKVNDLIHLALHFGLIPPLELISGTINENLIIDEEDEIILEWIYKDLQENLKNDAFLHILRMTAASGEFNVNNLMEFDSIIDANIKDRKPIIDSVFEKMIVKGEEVFSSNKEKEDDDSLIEQDEEVIDL